MLFAVLKKLDWFFKHYWKRYLFASLALIFVSAIGLIPPKLIGYTIDHIRFDSLTIQILTMVLLIYLSITIVHYVFSYLWMYTLFGGAVIIERWLRSKLMRHFLTMSPAFFEKFKTGDLMARSTNDLRAIYFTAGFGILTLVDATTFMFMIVFMMGFTISWKLTLAALIPLPFIGVVMSKYGTIIHQRFMKAQAAFSTMNNEVLESIRGVRVLRAFVQEKNDEARFAHRTEDVYDKNMEVVKIDALFEPTLNILVGLSYTIGLGYGTMLVFQNVITMGDLVTFNVYLGMLIWPMIAIGELINIMQRGNASIDRVNEVLRHNQDVKSPINPVDVPSLDEIKIENVTFSYPGTDTNQLDIDTMTIKKGETLGIVGKTGAGKTTLFKLLLREYPDIAGSITFSGVPIEQIDLEQLRSWIGYVPQDQFLFSKTIRENIQFGKENATDDEIYRVLELAHFLDDIKQLPAGLDTEVGESGVTLSGGQKQRVAIARAFIKNPDLLMLDDSLSAVDGKTEANILNHLKSERKGKTTMIAAHRLSAVVHADQIIVLEDGKIVERGTHDELMEQAGWYKEQYEQQQMKRDE